MRHRKYVWSEQMVQHTLCLIKPDAVKRGLIGAILDMIQKSGFKIAALKMLRLSEAEAEDFYAVHRDRPFFGSLTAFMASGPIVAAVLEGEDAVARYRKLMGATNPASAEEGTIRKLYAVDVEANSVHGSDALEAVDVEIAFFFSELEIVG